MRVQRCCVELASCVRPTQCHFDPRTWAAGRQPLQPSAGTCTQYPDPPLPPCCHRAGTRRPCSRTLRASSCSFPRASTCRRRRCSPHVSAASLVPTHATPSMPPLLPASMGARACSDGRAEGCGALTLAGAGSWGGGVPLGAADAAGGEHGGGADPVGAGAPAGAGGGGGAGGRGSRAGAPGAPGARRSVGAAGILCGHHCHAWPVHQEV